MTCGRHEMEALTEDGAFSVDILLRREGIAVEVMHHVRSRGLTAFRIHCAATLYKLFLSYLLHTPLQNPRP